MIRYLEAAAVHSCAGVACLELEDYVRIGVRRDFARQFQHYVRHRALACVFAERR